MMTSSTILLLLLTSLVTTSSGHNLGASIANAIIDKAEEHHHLQPPIRERNAHPFKGLGHVLISNDVAAPDDDVGDSTLKGDQPKVSTTVGQLVGASLHESQAFFNIPFAEPPIGELRFKAPQPLIGLSSRTLDVSVNKNIACFQKPDCAEGDCFTNFTEDCLVLNVFVPYSVNLSDPATPPSDHLPVLVWLHGGAFIFGSASDPRFDARYLSNVTNAIVVTTNYRLGIFGFIAYNESNGDSMNGNQGFKDQQLALQWVQDNIQNFGGDKARVTLFGQSAGGQSVTFHLLSQKSKPLFSNAISQSNAAGFHYHDLVNAHFVTELVLMFANCSSHGRMDCLRLVPPETLLDVTLDLMKHYIFLQEMVNTAEPMRIVLDGDEFSDEPITAFQKGAWNSDKRVIMGTTSEELYYVNGFWTLPVLPRDVYEWTMEFAFGKEVGDLAAQEYEKHSVQVGMQTDYQDALGMAVTDGIFVCPLRVMAKRASETAQHSDAIYLYSYQHGPDSPTCDDSLIVGGVCGHAYHSAENPFLFRTYDAYRYNVTDTDALVADQLSYFWGNFAASGDPSSGYVTSQDNYVTWPAYTGTDSNGYYDDDIKMMKNIVNLMDSTPPWSSLTIDDPAPKIEANYLDEVCDFWDSTGFYAGVTSETTTTEPVTSSPTSESTTVTTTTLAATETTSGSTSINVFRFYTVVNLLLGFIAVNLV